jgi:hypothetical protein
VDKENVSQGAGTSNCMDYLSTEFVGRKRMFFI